MFLTVFPFLFHLSSCPLFWVSLPGHLQPAAGRGLPVVFQPSPGSLGQSKGHSKVLKWTQQMRSREEACTVLGKAAWLSGAESSGPLCLTDSGLVRGCVNGALPTAPLSLQPKSLLWQSKAAKPFPLWQLAIPCRSLSNTLSLTGSQLHWRPQFSIPLTSDNSRTKTGKPGIPGYSPASHPEQSSKTVAEPCSDME